MNTIQPLISVIVPVYKVEDYIDQCINMVADWYKRYQAEDVYQLCVEQIHKYVS